MAGMRATLDLMLSVGVEAIEHRVLGLAGQVVEGVLEKGYRVAELDTAGRAFRYRVVHAGGAGHPRAQPAARRRGCIHHHILHQRIRLSPHFYNDRGDVEAAMAAL